MIHKLKLHWQILIAIGLAIIIGHLTGTDATFFGVTYFSMYQFVGDLFLNALKMIIVPLIVSSIITGVSGMPGGRDLGRLGAKTVGYYLITSFFAISVGLLFVNLIQPGLLHGTPAGASLGLEAISDPALMQKLQGHGAKDLANLFLSMIPPNIIAAAAKGQMLGLIFFSLLFGYFMMRVGRENARIMQTFWQAVFGVMMRITMLVMMFAPIGVFGLVAKTVAMTGFEAAEPIARFFVTVMVALACHLLLVLPFMMRFLGKITNPWRHFKIMSPALLTAFSTSSSSATLPLTIECVEKEARVSNKTCSFVLPLGATVNMDGTALYECVAAMFIAQAYGLDLTVSTQFMVVFVALLTSIGVAGVPSASLVAISIILTSIGLPMEGIGAILVVDRFLDMFRTMVNVFSDSCGAVIIAKTEGEKDVLVEHKHR